MAFDLKRANEIDDHYNLSVEKGSFVRKWFIENHSNLKKTVMELDVALN